MLLGSGHFKYLKGLLVDYSSKKKWNCTYLWSGASGALKGSGYFVMRIAVIAYCSTKTVIPFMALNWVTAMTRLHLHLLGVKSLLALVHLKDVTQRFLWQKSDALAVSQPIYHISCAEIKRTAMWWKPLPLLFNEVNNINWNHKIFSVVRMKNDGKKVKLAVMTAFQK